MRWADWKAGWRAEYLAEHLVGHSVVTKVALTAVPLEMTPAAVRDYWKAATLVDLKAVNSVDRTVHTKAVTSAGRLDCWMGAN